MGEFETFIIIFKNFHKVNKFLFKALNITNYFIITEFSLVKLLFIGYTVLFPSEYFISFNLLNKMVCNKNLFL